MRNNLFYDIKKKLVEWKAPVDTVGIKSADLEDKFLFEGYAAYRTANVKRKAANCHMLLRMISKVKLSSNWFGCFLDISFYVVKLFSESIT